jgi:hypothetical protein
VSRIGDSSPTGAFAPVFIFPQEMNIVAALWLVAGVAVLRPLRQFPCAFLSARTPYLLPVAPTNNFLLIIVSARNLNFTFNKINQVESK